MKFVFPGAAYEEKAKEFFRNSGLLVLHFTVGVVWTVFWRQALMGSGCRRFTRIWILLISRRRVPAYTCFYVRERDGCLVGMISIRLALNDFLRKEGGHIGYCIRPSERGKVVWHPDASRGSEILQAYRFEQASSGLRQIKPSFGKGHTKLWRNSGNGMPQ